MQGEWLQVNLNAMQKVTGVVIQCCPHQDKWVTTLKIQHSTDSTSWIDCSVDGQVRPLVLVSVLLVLHKGSKEKHLPCGFQVQVLPGLLDRNTPNTRLLGSPVSAQDVRVWPLKANGQAGLCLEVLGCSLDCKRPFVLRTN